MIGCPVPQVIGELVAKCIGNAFARYPTYSAEEERAFLLPRSPALSWEKRTRFTARGGRFFSEGIRGVCLWCRARAGVA